MISKDNTTLTKEGWNLTCNSGKALSLITGYGMHTASHSIRVGPSQICEPPCLQVNNTLKTAKIHHIIYGLLEWSGI